MPERLFMDEARQCRRWARELRGRPEETLLLRIAHAFDALAVERAPCAGWVPQRHWERRVP